MRNALLPSRIVGYVANRCEFMPNAWTVVTTGTPYDASRRDLDDYDTWFDRDIIQIGSAR